MITIRTNAWSEILHAPTMAEDGYVVYDPVLELATNEAGKLTFTVYPDHPLYDQVIPFGLDVFVWEDNRYVWDGRVVSVVKGFYGELDVECEGSLNYLLDAYWFMESFSSVSYQTVRSIFTTEYRTRTAFADHYIYGGTWDLYDSTDTFEYDFVEPVSFFDSLDDIVPYEDEGGMVRIRYENGQRYLDHTGTYRTNTQPISCGINLLSYSEEVDAADLFTALLPYGSKISDTSYTNIRTANSGVEYVVNSTALAAYGMIEKVMHWDKYTDATKLLAKANRYLNKYSGKTFTTISAKAVDLHWVDDSYQMILPDDLLTVSKPNGDAVQLPCVKAKINIAKPQNSTFELGKKIQTLSKIVKKK